MIGLAGYNQWIVYRLEQQPGILKPTKVPYNPHTGRGASSTDASTWGSLAQAEAALATGAYSGLGFVFSQNDPYFFLDLDGCRNSDNGTEYLPDAVAIMSMFPGAAWEVSQSGEGIHIVGRCDLTRLGLNRRHRWRVGAVGCEFYTDMRFMALGRLGLAGWQGNTELDHTNALDVLVPIKPEGTDGVLIEGIDGPRADWNGPTDDQELIQRACKARGGPGVVLGTKAPFRALWEADAHVLAKFFPQEGGGRLYDASAADQALMNALGFWTGCDVERMARLFGQSKLATVGPDGGARDKWFKRAYYRNRTVSNTIQTCRVVYNGNAIERAKKQKAEAAAIGDDNIDPNELFAPILKLNEMIDRFYLILDGNKDGVGMIDRFTRKPRSMTQAKVFYSSSLEDVPTGKVDPVTGMEITKKAEALDLWRVNPARRHVDMVTWLPDGPEITRDAERNGNAFNIWSGLIRPKYADHYLAPENVAEREGWLRAWHAHLAYLVPIQEERERFEQWLAHILQKPGELPQTAYLMFTDGVTGIGRGWLSIIMANVLRGYTALGVNISAAVDDKGFNGRLSRKLLATVDEAKAGMLDGNRYQRAETLKSRINEKYREIKNKYGMEWTEYNCMRWLFFSNHADALPFDQHDRRIVVIANPNNRANSDYYEWIYSLINSNEFISSVWAHLMTLDISTFKPGEHAPMNQAKLRSLGAMENPMTRALRDWLEEQETDKIVTVRNITTALQMEHDINMVNVAPKTIAYTLKACGIEVFPKRLKVLGKNETIALIRPERYNLSDFWDISSGNWLPGMAETVSRVVSNGGKLR